MAYGLFFVGIGAAVAAHWLYRHQGDTLRRAAGIALGVVAFGCFGVATAVPFIFHVPAGRPSSSARLQILSPHPREAFRGDPATIPVELRLEGGKITPVTSLHLVPNEGHIHLYVDGSLVLMTGLDTRITASPGEHTLRVEFVAVDHGPFKPRIQATVTFQVRA